MRSVQDEAAVRLYHLDHESGAVTTILYGSLADALAAAAAQPAEARDGLFLQTREDVVSYRDMID